MASRSMKKSGKKMQVYNAVGSKAVEAATDETPGFKKGGKAGGAVDGKKSMGRADKKMRHKRAAGGRTPYSSAKMTEGEADSTAGEGHESARP